MRRTLLVLAAALALPASAQAAAPANDAPAGAAAFSAFTAENGTPTARQAIATLAEATADAGVARCLGASSFDRTVWFRVPAAGAVRTVTVSGTGGSGQSAAQPDLAAFVVDPGATAPVEPQACDGAEVEKDAMDLGAAPEVSVRVPAGRDVLVQVGRPAGQAAEPVVLSESETALPQAPAPAGDAAGAAPRLKLGSTAQVPLGGATLTAEDPAQPACPASATVWRKVRVTATGTQTVRVAGAAVSAVTAFLGARPGADNATGCVQRTVPGTYSLDVPAKRGDVLWVRVGTESSAAAAVAAVRVLGPRTPKVSAGLVSARSRVRLSATGGSLTKVRVKVQRRVGTRYRTVATASLASLAQGKTRTVRLKGSAKRAGRYRILVTATSAGKPVTSTRTTTLKRAG